MPISPILLQRRHAELGRIRLGAKGAKGQPQKLSSLRFTSPNERYIADLANLYGGEAKAWDNNGKPEHEVYTEASSIPVIAVRGGMSQWMETWSGGGCTHRCDGERDVEGNPCNVDDPGHKNAKPTTRLSVMLPELEAVGVFRLETHGWNAAAEIPAVAELAQFVGDLVPAHLHLVERRAIRDGKTSRFVVPVLDLQIGTARLKEVVAAVSGQAPAPATLSTNEVRALEDGPGRPDYEGLAADATTSEELRALWEQAGQAGHLDDALKTLLSNRAHDFAPPEETADPIEGTVAPADADAVWMQIVTVAGKQGTSEPDLRAELQRELGVTAEDATAEQLQVFLRALQGGTS